jgi:hypothetical protein
MRGTVVKALRKRAKNEATIAAETSGRKVRHGEIEMLYRAKKEAYKIFKRSSQRPKLKESPRQKRIALQPIGVVYPKPKYVR